MMFISAVKNSTLEKYIYSFRTAFLELAISKKKNVFFKEEFFFLFSLRSLWQQQIRPVGTPERDLKQILF